MAIRSQEDISAFTELVAARSAALFRTAYVVVGDHQLAQDLLHDPKTQERMERLKARVLGHPQVLTTATSLWNAFRRALLASLDDREGPVRRRALDELRAFGGRLTCDAALRTKLDGYAADLAVFAVSRYGDELTAVITHTIDRWDGKEAARRIELHVGRDLQFMRINGRSGVAAISSACR